MPATLLYSPSGKMTSSVTTMASSSIFVFLTGFYLFASVAKLSGVWTPLSVTPSILQRGRGLRHGYGGETNLGRGKLGAVASESALCSGFGIEMLKQGGNAADAVS